jgi:hypothetical protein
VDPEVAVQVPDGLDPVGVWYYEFPTSTAAARPELRMASAAASALSVLSPAALLVPKSIRCERWLTTLDNRPEKAAIPPMTLATKDTNWNPADLAVSIRRHLDQHEGASETYPADLEIRGGGYIVSDSDDQVWRNNLCQLNVAYEEGDVIVAVETHSDVWLPFDLEGSPQLALSAANHPRLSAVLRTLASLWGNEPDTGARRKYAVALTYGVENARDVDGEVIATRDW